MTNLRTFLITLLLLPGWALAQQQQQTAPEILFEAALVDLTDQPATLAHFRGQPLVVNFWARWCGPCRTEIPHFIAEYARTKSTGVQVVGIALDDKPDAVRDFVKAYDINYPVLLIKDNGPDLLKQIGNPQAGLPYTLIIDRSDKIVARKLGPMSHEELIAALKAIDK
jgi:thiol-disulfide isomerase/thioredoxin